jgi:hypothetical protein
MNYIRIWTEIDLQEIEDHIIMVDDILGFCPGCKKIGIELTNLTNCPSCDREFKYVTSKEAKGNKRAIIPRIRKKLPNLIFIDYDDYYHFTGEKNAKRLFN